MPDRDGPLHTDAPYGLADLSEPMLRWPVGRTPDADPLAPGLLAGQLHQIARAHAVGSRQSGQLLAISAARWAAVTAELLAGLPEAVIQLAPPFVAGKLAATGLADAGLVVCNLHGVLGGDSWYGQAPNDTELVPALRPTDLTGLRLAGTVVVTQACFGARLAPVGEGLTLAAAMLAAGASGLFGALGLTYGAPDPPPGESDLLARALLQGLREPGARLGQALVAAQAATLREALRRQGSPDADDLKTLLGFLLYGDPMLAV